MNLSRTSCVKELCVLSAGMVAVLEVKDEPE